jgi:hypothetical protein
MAWGEFGSSHASMFQCVGLRTSCCHAETCLRVQGPHTALAFDITARRDSSRSLSSKRWQKYEHRVLLYAHLLRWRRFIGLRSTPGDCDQQKCRVSTGVGGICSAASSEGRPAEASSHVLSRAIAPTVAQACRHEADLNCQAKQQIGSSRPMRIWWTLELQCALLHWWALSRVRSLSRRTALFFLAVASVRRILQSWHASVSLVCGQRDRKQNKFRIKQRYLQSHAGLLRWRAHVAKFDKCRHPNRSAVASWVWRHWAYWHLDSTLAAISSRSLVALAAQALGDWRSVIRHAKRLGLARLRQRFDWALRDKPHGKSEVKLVDDSRAVDWRQHHIFTRLQRDATGN